MLEYGKIITSQSFFKGKQTNEQIAYSIPVLIEDKSQLLSEIIKAVDLIDNKLTHTVKLTISAGKDFKLKMITKEYICDIDNSKVDTV